MPVLLDLDLELNVDQILRGQGVDPAVVRKRNQNIISLAEQAFRVGRPLIEPVVAYRQFKITSLKHERVSLSGGGVLSGKLVASLLGPAEQVVVMVCTIGGALESFASAMLPKDPPYGLALDALGSAAVEALTVSACRHFGDIADSTGMHTTLPLSPGMDGWPAERGQLQIFQMVDPQEAGVDLTESGMMIPQKSLSLVLGMGAEVGNNGRICDYCAMRFSCRYQDHYG